MAGFGNRNVDTQTGRIFSGRISTRDIMKNYVIHYEPSDKHSVLNLVRNFSNDIQIDYAQEDRVGITIELDDPEADGLYDKLYEEVKEMIDVRQKHYTGD